MKFIGRVSPRELNIAMLNLIVAFGFALFVMFHPAVSAWVFLRLIAEYMLLTIGLSLLALLCYMVLNARDGGMVGALRDRWQEDRLVTLFWPMLCFALVMPSFSAFKQRILPLAGFRFDPALAAIDRILFGINPGLWLHQTVGSPLLTQFLDLVYHAWFVPMLAGVGIVALCTDARTRMQYMTAYTLNWVGLASILAYLLPAAGPCFYEALVGFKGSAPFNAVNDALFADRAAGPSGTLFTLNIKAMLLRNFDNPSFSMGGGISAIPSIHNAMAVLFALVAYRFNRGFGYFMSGFAALIWIGSIYLNWHYAIDGIVGAAGAVTLWFLAGRIVRVTEGDESLVSEPRLVAQAEHAAVSPR
jgi:hypothetical protein